MKNIGLFSIRTYTMYLLLLAVLILPNASGATGCYALFKGNPTHPPYTFLSDGTVNTVIRPSTLREYNALEHSISAYEKFQANIYGQRLPKYQTSSVVKSPTQDTPKLRTAVDFRQRSIYILNTAGAIDVARPAFHGGIRIVLARRSEDTLPFELDPSLGGRRRREEPAAEVGRFTVDESSSFKQKRAERSVTLIRAAIREIISYEDVQTIYVHTSRVHVRLYKMMGLEPLEVIGEDPLNQIMVFTRTQLQDFLKPQALKALATAGRPNPTTASAPARPQGF